MVNVTQGRFPFWNMANHSDEECRLCKFQTVEGLISHFQHTFDKKETKVTKLSSTSVLETKDGALNTMCVDDEQAVGYIFLYELA